MVPVGVRRFRLAGKRGECAMSFMCRSKSMGTGRSNVTDKPISVLLRNSWYKYPPATVRKRPGRLICHPVHSFSEPSRMPGIALCGASASRDGVQGCRATQPMVAHAVRICTRIPQDSSRLLCQWLKQCRSASAAMPLREGDASVGA